MGSEEPKAIGQGGCAALPLPTPEAIRTQLGSILASPVNGGVKAGHWGGAKTGQFCGVGIEHDAPRPPRRRWPGFRSRGGRGFQEARMISPISGSAAAATSSGGRGSLRRLAFDCLSR